MAGQVPLSRCQECQGVAEGMESSSLLFHRCKGAELPSKQNFFLLPGVDISLRAKRLNIF